MRASNLLLVGIGVGAIFTYALFYEPTLQQESEFDGIDVSDRVRRWETKKRFRPGADAFAGPVNEHPGSARGDKDFVTEAIDRNALAGSENSLGAESVRDGRPSTDDSVVEAMDEGTPGQAGR